MTLPALTPHPRIATKLNLVAVLAGLALCALSVASLQFAKQISNAARHIRAEAITAVVASAELGVLVERHRRIVEAAPVTFDKVRIGRDKRLSDAIATRIKEIVGTREHAIVSPIVELLPEFLQRGERVLHLSENFAQDEALKAVDEYGQVAKRVHDRIVTYREYNLREANADADMLIQTVRKLVNWILVAALFAAALVGPLTIIAVRHIAERLRGITQSMLALARDDTSVEIPCRDSADEIGEMARAMAVFKANAIALHQKHAEIATLNSRFDIALNNMARGLSMFDASGCLIVSNCICREMYDLPEAFAAPGRPFRDIVLYWARRHDAGDAAEIEQRVTSWLDRHAQKIATGEEFSDIHRLEDGRIYAINTKPLPGGGWVDVHENITEKQLSSERIANLAQKDTLTGLANRHSFLEELEATFAGSKSAAAFAILWIDLDRFKEVNDSYGHPAGDALLQVIAQRLRQAVRGDDFVARLGGDEFAIIVRGENISSAALSRIAARITDVVNQPASVMGHSLSVGASIGISSAPHDARTPDDIMKTADIALYRAKADGRGKAVFFNPEMAEALLKRRRLQTDLESAVRQEALELYYQPILCLASRRVVSFEALMRWRHAEFGFISPAEFIPLAEETGLITEMGAWALAAACRAAAQWPGGIGVSVNLSASQFRTTDLESVTKAALEVSGLAPQRLQLEVTETLLLYDEPETWSMLARLKALGVSIALDDFGTGYSSLSYLRSFPFDKIKIDQSFVRGEGRRSDGITIVRAITDLAHTLGMKTVAEGVESAEHLAQIEAACCDEVQGYLFSRPVPEKDVIATLRSCDAAKAA